VSRDGVLCGESWLHVGESRPLARQSAKIHVGVVEICRITIYKGIVSSVKGVGSLPIVVGKREDIGGREVARRRAESAIVCWGD
jgi:hypothetical protein